MENPKAPKVSVIILNYNGRPWLPRCLSSLERQSNFSDLEIIIPDNQSTDGSDQTAEAWCRDHPNSVFIQNGSNLGYCEGNNRGAAAAKGQYLFFLNNDTWLEPDCLETAWRESERVRADAATPLVLNYEDDTFQSLGSPGIDWFGLSGTMKLVNRTTPIFAASGCSLLVRAEIFRTVGGFDPLLFMYADETDLAWRIGIAGGRVFAIPSARLHHRTPVAPTQPIHKVLSELKHDKRYLANRNGILFILKNAQHILFLLLVPHLLLLFAEGCVSLILLRNWPFFRDAYLRAARDAFASLPHVLACRRNITSFRKHGDFWMLRFLQLRPSRWKDFQRLWKKPGTKDHPPSRLASS